MSVLLVFTGLMFAYSLVSARVERVATAPLVFVLAGMVVPLLIPELRSPEYRLTRFLWVAEAGLVLLLFTDATRTNLSLLRKTKALPARLLGPGLLMTIGLGALLAGLLFGHLSFWEACIVGAILAPTDAGLGQVIVQSPRVPERIREALNVEAGLNDGMSVPFLLFFIALLDVAGGASAASLATFIWQQLGLGVLVGAGIGLAGGWLLQRAVRTGRVTPELVPRGVVALPIFCVIAAEAVGASMFIAAFVAGLATQTQFHEAGSHAVDFTEQWGGILNLAVFFLFGVLVYRVLGRLQPIFGVYALLSLTVVRMLPVALALLGTGLSRATGLFMGWFGPRGLASVVLGLVFVEQEIHTAGETTIQGIVIVTVLASVLLHGLSAQPGIAWYARRVAALPPGAPELAE
ncbi:MAG TPA: cation:proton antiporter [Gemmatimonadales bacterium]|nr:cation:proton antiporter [Gemmatimonadales bacterium]